MRIFLAVFFFFEYLFFTIIYITILFSFLPLFLFIIFSTVGEAVARGRVCLQEYIILVKCVRVLDSVCVCV